MDVLRKLVLFAVALLLLAVAPSSHAAYKDDIGYTDLANELGAGVPTGAGITATQVEAQETDGDYTPDATHAEFSDTTINVLSGASGPSTHATTVGRYLYGNSSSMAPDVNTVDSYDANDWINSELFGGGSTPTSESRDIQNHSWVGNMDTDANNQEAMRRHDYMINQDNFLATVGVNNGSSNSQPNRLMAHAYNSLAVGRSDGGHNYGDTALDEPGRLKPEIVAPLSATSYATPVVGAAGAMLFETVDNNASLANARNSEAAKALLLAGATKDEFADWDRTNTRPLDQVYGAGELNIYNSYHALVAGEQESSNSSDVNTMGWDFDQMPTDTASGELLYFFEVAENQVLEDLSAILSWNRDVTVSSGGPLASYNASVANLKMELFSASSFNLGTLLDYSDSTVDNLEHIYNSALGSGRYALRLTGDTSDQDFALAWYANVATIPEPTAGVMLLLAGTALYRRRRR